MKLDLVWTAYGLVGLILVIGTIWEAIQERRNRH